ncbi:hypothetical protein BCF74_11343 [Knoellia remsis]|uniref:DUF4333 domain-containing protein n=1 Tax=Knoellia remsis TaxID=407159 RepID=A0A2T0UJL7_9MICO|nr:hypothetical protein [Knoellia remsis]PRY58120.1 hypothetical protein BCF74_11343 [Knoellia remsis]
MSSSFPPPSGQPGPYAAAPAHGAPYPYGGPAAYGGAPGGQPPSRGFNPWLAAGLGALGGAIMTTLLAMVMWFAMGYPMPWETPQDYAAEWTGQVDPDASGRVPGPVLSDAVTEMSDGYYVDVSCPDTPRVTADITTVCRVDDGIEPFTAVVLFLNDSGDFEVAEFYTANGS